VGEVKAGRPGIWVANVSREATQQSLLELSGQAAGEVGRSGRAFHASIALPVRKFSQQRVASRHCPAMARFKFTKSLLYPMPGVGTYYHRSTQAFCAFHSIPRRRGSELLSGRRHGRTDLVILKCTAARYSGCSTLHCSIYHADFAASVLQNPPLGFLVAQLRSRTAFQTCRFHLKLCRHPRTPAAAG
jgi:hypothetical protein